MSDAVSALKKTQVTNEELLAAVKKAQLTIEELLATDAEVFFENIFATRHIGRVVDLMLFKCRGFIDAHPDPGYVEYRFRQIIELLIFNGWSNYRRGEKAKYIETEIGWDKNRMIVSIAHVADDGVSGFVPGNTDFARDETSQRMARMFGLVQELADGLIIRHDARTGRIRAVAFISAAQEEKLPQAEFVDLKDAPTEEQRKPADQPAPKVETPVELSAEKLDLFLADENAPPELPADEPAKPEGEFEQRFSSTKEEELKTRIAGSQDKADDFLQVVKGGGKKEDEAETRIAGSKAEATDNTVTRIDADKKPAQKDDFIARFSKEKAPLLDQEVKRFSKEPAAPEDKTVRRFAADKTPTEEKSYGKGMGMGVGGKPGADGASKPDAKAPTGMAAMIANAAQASAQAAKSEKVDDARTIKGAGARAFGESKVAAGSPGATGTQVTARERLLAGQIATLQKQVETLQGTKKPKAGAEPGEGYGQGTPREIALAAQNEALQQQLDKMKDEKMVSAGRAISDALADHPASPKAGPREKLLASQNENLQKQVEALQREKKILTGSAPKGSEPAPALGAQPTGVREKVLVSQNEALQKQVEALQKEKKTLVGSAPGAPSGPIGGGAREKTLTTQVETLQKQVETLQKEKRAWAMQPPARIGAQAAAAAGPAAAAQASAREKALTLQVEALQQQVEAAKSEKMVAAGKAIAESSTDEPGDKQQTPREKLLAGQNETLHRQLEALQKEKKEQILKAFDESPEPEEKEAQPTPREKMLTAQVGSLQRQIETLQNDRKELLEGMAESKKAAADAVSQARAQAEADKEKEVTKHKDEIEKSDVSDPAKEWVRGMMEEVVRERAEIRQKVGEVDKLLRKKEHEFKSQETILHEQVRRLEHTLKQRETVIERGKDTVASLQASLDKLKAGGEDEQDKVELAHKLITAEKLLESEKNNLERMQKRVDDSQKKVAEELAHRGAMQQDVQKYKKQVEDLQRKLTEAQATGQKGSAMELQTVTEQRDKNLRVIEELKRQNQELQLKLTTASSSKGLGGAAAQSTDKKGATSHGEAELKHKLDLAERLNKNAKDEVEKMKKRLEEGKQQESKLRGEVAKLQGDLTKLQTEIKAAGIRSAAAKTTATNAAAAPTPKPGGLKPK